MAEEYTFNIKLKVNEETTKSKPDYSFGRGSNDFERLLNKATEVLRDISSLDIRSMKASMGSRGTQDFNAQDRIKAEKSAIEEQIALLKGLRSFSPAINTKEWAEGKKDTDPSKKFIKGYEKPQEKAELQSELKKDMDRQFHSIAQTTDDIKKSLEQQRKTFLDYHNQIKALKAPSNVTTFAGERITVQPERSLQQMVAPNIFTRQLELQIEKLSKVSKAQLAKEMVRVKSFLDDTYEEISTALNQVGYEAHKKAKVQVDKVKEEIDKIAGSGDLEKISKNTEASIRSGKLMGQVGQMRKSIEEASNIFSKELGSEMDKARKSFEQFQRNIIFTFQRPQFFDPAGPEFRDVESMSQRKGMGMPIGGSYAGAPRITFDEQGMAKYQIIDVKALAKETANIMQSSGLKQALGTDFSSSIQRAIDKYLDEHKISRRIETLMSYAVNDLKKIQLDLIGIAQKELQAKVGDPEAKKRIDVFNKYIESVSKQDLSIPSMYKSSRGAGIIRDPERGEYLTLSRYLEARPGVNQLEDQFMRPMMDAVRKLNFRPQEQPSWMKDLGKIVKDFWVRSRPGEGHGVGIGTEAAAKETLHRVKESFDMVSQFLKETRGPRAGRAVAEVQALKKEFLTNYYTALRESIRTTEEKLRKEQVISGKTKLPEGLEKRYREELKPLVGKGARYELLPEPVVSFLRQESSKSAKRIESIPVDKLESVMQKLSQQEKEIIGKSDYSNRVWQRALDEFSKYRQVDFYNLLNRAASFSKEGIPNELERLRNSLSSAGRLNNESYFQELIQQQFKKVFDPIKEKVPEEHEAMQKHEVYGKHKVITIQPKLPGMEAGPSSYGVPVDLQAKKRFIVQRNLEMEDLVEKEMLRGVEKALRKLGPNIERLATVGLNEASAAGDKDWGEQFVEKFFKGKMLQPFASYDPRQTEAFGRSINPGRPTGAAWDSLAGLEFNAVRSKKAQELIKTGQFGTYGTGLNLTTVLKDVSQGYEDLYEIGKRMQEMATFKFKKEIVPNLKKAPEQLKEQAIKYLDDLGSNLFGSPISIKGMADETWVTDIVKRWAQSPKGPVEENIVEMLDSYLGHEARKLSSGQIMKGVGATIFGRMRGGGKDLEEEVAAKAKKGMFPKVKFEDIGELVQVPKTIEELFSDLIKAKRDLDPEKVKQALEMIKGTRNMIMMSSEDLKKFKMSPIEHGTGKIMGQEGSLSLEQRKKELGKLLQIDFSGGSSIKSIEQDVNKLREVYKKNVGDLTREVPVDLRMSASGLGKASRMIGGNLAELITNNIIGNLRSKPLKGETLMEQIQREPLAKVVVEDTASGIEARKLAEKYKDILGLKGKYGEEFVFSKGGQMEKAIAGTIHMMVMKEPKGWVPKGAEHLVKGASKMTIDPHAWFGLQKLFEPGGAFMKEFTTRAFPEAREAGSFIDALRSFAKMREEEIRQDKTRKVIGAKQLTQEGEEGYVAPLKRKATVADLGSTIFDAFKFGKAMTLELPEPTLRWLKL